MTGRHIGVLVAVLMVAGAFTLQGCPGKSSANLTKTYSAPYLLDFSFSLYDRGGHAVVVEPSELAVKAKESGNPISPSETAFILAKGDNKELKSFLVLDYTASMYASGAIEAMETDAKDFINQLNVDAQIGIYEFHREDVDPATGQGLVADFSTDKNYLASRIDAIQSEFVRGFPASTRCWDSVYAALGHFTGQNSMDERRFLLFLSDGRDESSTHKPSDIIKLADTQSVRIFPIGFGEEVNPGDLKDIARKTGGKYYGAKNVQQLQEQFQQIVHDLGGQYLLRWATLRREGSFKPSFTVKKGLLKRTFKESEFSTEKYAGDVLGGLLRIPEYSVRNGKARVFLRALYVPRYITQLRFTVKSGFPFTASLVDQETGGLCADWAAPAITAIGSGEYRVELVSRDPGDRSTSIVFGGFGPMVYFDFANLPANAGQAFFEIKEIDNSIYDNGQSFSVQNAGSAL